MIFGLVSAPVQASSRSLLARLAPQATVEGVRAELTASYSAMVREHPESYPERAQMQLTVTPLRDQITAPARPEILDGRSILPSG